MNCRVFFVLLQGKLDGIFFVYAPVRAVARGLTAETGMGFQLEDCSYILLYGKLLLITIAWSHKVHYGKSI